MALDDRHWLTALQQVELVFKDKKRLHRDPRCTGQGTHAPVRAGSASAQSVTTTTRGKLTMKIDDDTWNAIVAETKGRIANWNDIAAEKGRPEVFEVRATTGDSYQLLITIHHDHGRGTRRRYRQAAQGDKNQGGHQNISSAKGLDKARRQTRRDDRLRTETDRLHHVPGRQRGRGRGPLTVEL